MCSYLHLPWTLHVGFSDSDLRNLRSHCMKFLRKLFHAPVYVTRESHQAFLLRHQLPEPLEYLRKLCLKTQHRERSRLVHLASDDILHFQQPLAYDTLIQAIDRVIQALWEPSLSQSVFVHVCPECSHCSDSLTAHRKHLTICHGSRTGPLKPFAPSDAQHGVPTCVHCGMRFTTWVSFRYHITHVCTATALHQDPVDQLCNLEHRVRIAELLQYSNSMNFQAITSDDPLLVYFRHRCIICGMAQRSSRGMLLHWSTEHSLIFQRHGELLRLLHSQHPLPSPCPLCGCSFKRAHNCIIYGQLAMHDAQLPQGRRTQQLGDQKLFQCPHCPKAYVTSHGLRGHLARYHQAMQAGDPELDPALDHQHRIFCQAVEEDQVETLLQNPQILEHLGTRCMICQTLFKQRNLLTRHLRHHHADLWNLAEPMALELQGHYGIDVACHCIPPLRSKHICLIFLQFSLYQQHCMSHIPFSLTTTPGLDDAVLPTGDGDLATTQQHIGCLLYYGQLEQLYQRVELRMVLTIHCMICDRTFTDGDQLQTHLWNCHNDLFRAADRPLQFLQHVLFCNCGCLCNPGPGYGVYGHTCVPLRQIAMLFCEMALPLLLPYPFKAVDLIDLLSNYMSPYAVEQVTFNMVARRCNRIWGFGPLLRLLRSRCLVCQCEIDLHDIWNHLDQEHRMAPSRFIMHLQQLAEIFIERHSDDYDCDLCMCRWYDDDDHVSEANTMLRNHLQRCPVVLQFAVLLSYPVWDTPMTDEFAWPTQGMIQAFRERRTIRLRSFNVATSDFGYTMFDLMAHSARAYPPNATRRPSVLMMVCAVRLGTCNMRSRKERPSPHFLVSGIFAHDHTPQAHTHTSIHTRNRNTHTHTRTYTNTYT